MKMSQKALEYILLLLIVAIGFCAYQFGYVKFNEKAEQVKQENKQYRARIDELNQKLANQETYVTGIRDAQTSIDKVLEKYGPGNTPEKSIMMVTKLQEAANMEISNVAFNGDNVLLDIPATEGDEASAIEMDKTFLAINYSTDYAGLKSCMDFINAYPERMNVASFTAAFNQETAGLSGSMLINLFGVKDYKHEYKEPTVGGILIGTDNIFGTIERTGELGEAGEAPEVAGE